MEHGSVTTDRESVSRRLEPIRMALDADGYKLECDAADERRVSLRVRATAAACPECLVPKEMMARMVADQLGSAVTISLHYPDE